MTEGKSEYTTKNTISYREQFLKQGKSRDLSFDVIQKELFPQVIMELRRERELER